MPKKAIRNKDRIWINPKFSLKSPKEQRAWEQRPLAGIPNVSRYLELADIALGARRQERRKKVA